MSLGGLRKSHSRVIGCFLGIFRSIFGVVFGVIVFGGFFTYLVITNVEDNFLSAEFYTGKLDEENDNGKNVYDRIYEDVLADPEYKKGQELQGGIKIDPQDRAEVAEQIIPRAYLQSQVEGAITGAIDYLNKETEDPAIFIDLGPPLDNVKPALLEYIDRRIEGLNEVPVTTIAELEAGLDKLFRTLNSGDIPAEIPVIEDPAVLVSSYVDDTVKGLRVIPTDSPEDFQRELEVVYKKLNQGGFPDSVPSVDAIPVSLRGPTFDVVLASLKDDPSIPPLVTEGLTRERAKIIDQLEKGCVTGEENAACGATGAMQEATQALTGPVVDQFLDDAFDLAFARLEGDPTFPSVALEGLRSRAEDIKTPLGKGDVKDALKVGARAVAGPIIDQAIGNIEKELDEDRRLDLVKVAAENSDKSRKDFLKQADFGRNLIDSLGIGVAFAILAVAGGSLLMGLIQIPHMSSFFRVPGITLLLSGTLFLILGIVANSQVSGLLNDLIDRGAEGKTVIPDSMIDVISDVIASMASDIAGGFIVPSVAIMVVGLVLIVVSGLIRMLHIPFLSR